MAPQRRTSQRQRTTKPATVSEVFPDTTDSPDCQAEPDQPQQQQQEQDGAAAAKRPRRQSSTRNDAVTPVVAVVSDMEAERAARIAANQARLAALELPQLAADLAATAAAASRSTKKPAASQRGVSSKRSREQQQEMQPRRVSARARGQAPDPTTAAGIDSEGRDGRVVLAAAGSWGAALAGISGGAVSDSEAAAAAASQPPPPPGPLPFSSSNGDEATDAAFLKHLQAASSSSAAAGDDGSTSHTRSNISSSVCGVDALSKLQLAAVDVAKLTTQGVSCLTFHPTSSKPIIAAADKSGKVGLWDVDFKADDGSDGGTASSSSGDYDGVLMFEPHRDYISSLKWLGPSGAALLTSSYDGTVRRLDVDTGVWDLVAGVPDSHDNNFSAGDATPDGSTIYLATSSGLFTQLDTRANSASTSTSTQQQLMIANRKVNTLQLHDDGLHLLSSASDGTVAVYDVRQLASSNNSSKKLCKPVASASHHKSSQGAYWEPNGGARVLSISFDDTLRIWQFGGSGALTQQVSIRHNNNTGRWVMPFRPAWSLTGDGVLVGDLKRGVALFRDSGAAVGVLSAPEALTAIPSRVALHRDGIVAAATSSGRVHCFR